MVNREYEDLCVAYEMHLHEQGCQQHDMKEFCEVCGPEAGSGAHAGAHLAGAHVAGTHVTDIHMTGGKPVAGGDAG